MACPTACSLFTDGNMSPGQRLAQAGLPESEESVRLAPGSNVDAQLTLVGKKAAFTTPASLLALTGLSAQEMSTFPKMGQVFSFDLWFFPREAELLVFLQEVRGRYGAQWAHRAWTLPVP